MTEVGIDAFKPLGEVLSPDERWKNFGGLDPFPGSMQAIEAKA